MTTFKIHTIESAPESAKPILEQLEQGIGFVPNLAATMADSPSVLKAYVTLHGIFSSGSFSPVERELVAMATSYANQCTYCMAAHSTFARVQGAPNEVLWAVRDGKLPNDPRLAALVGFTFEVARNGGLVSDKEIEAFREAGFTQGQVLEVLVGVSQSTLASLVHNMTATPVDTGFLPLEWTPA